MRRRLMISGLVLGALALAACGSGGPRVQAGQAGDSTTTTTAPESTTTTTGSTTTTAAPTTTTAPATVPAPPCTPEALGAAYAAKFGNLPAATTLRVQKCVDGWATSVQSHGFDPPSFALYRVEGDHWLALNRSAGKLCTGQGVPPEVAPQIGCDT